MLHKVAVFEETVSRRCLSSRHLFCCLMCNRLEPVDSRYSSVHKVYRQTLNRPTGGVDVWVFEDGLMNGVWLSHLTVYFCY